MIRKLLYSFLLFLSKFFNLQFNKHIFSNSKTLCLVAFLVIQCVSGQVANYTFSQTTSTFSSITGTSAIGNNWDDNVSANNIPLGFTFTFNNANYTTCSVNSNGYLTFGTSLSANNGFIPISAGTGYAGAISAFGMDLTGNSAIVYTTTGTAPNRVFIVEWKSARRYNGGTNDGNLNFQIRLNETTNLIQFVYGSCTTNGIDLAAQVGLRGGLNSDYNNRSVTTGIWAASTAGGNNVANCSNNSGRLPSSGLTFNWTPVCSTNSFTSVTPITNVSLNTLNKTTSASSTTAYEDFTGDVFKTSVAKSQYYALTVKGNTGGDVNAYYTAFIDWNNDGDFDDVGEYSVLGTIRNSSGTDSKVASAYIQVPPAAATGNIKMRIFGRQVGYSTVPCSASGSIGQIEDYLINVLSGCSGTSGTPVSTASSVCPNAPFVLSLPSSTLTDGATYVWQTSPDGNAPWTDATPKPRTFFGTEAFNSLPANTNVYGSATISSSGQLILTPATNSLYGGYVIQTMPGTSVVDAFTVNFDYQIPPGGGADGFSLSYAGDIASDAGGGEGGQGTGIIIQFDTFDNEGVTQGSRVRIQYAGNTLYNSAIDAPSLRPTSGDTPVILTVDARGRLLLKINGQTVVSDLALPAAYLSANKSTWKFKFAARTGGSNDIHIIDNLLIRYLDLTNAGPTFTTSQTVKTYYRVVTTCGGTPTPSGSVMVDVTSATISAMTAPACTGTLFTVTPTNVTNGTIPSGTVYTWAAPVVTGGITGGAASTGSLASITGTLTNPTATAQTATYTVTPITGTCTGIPFTLTVTVNPLPTITGTSNVCIGSTTQLTGSGTADTTTPWASATPTVATVSNTGLVTGVAAGTSVITYKNNNGCTQTVTVTVNPLPTITGTSNVCVGSTTQLAGSGTADTTTPWASATPSVATVSNTGLVTGVAAGTSVITYKNNNGCTQTVTVTVNPLPTITGTLNVCIGLTTQLTGSATANVTTPWTSATPSVATVSNTGLVTAVAVGTSVITYRNSNGCTQTTTVTVNSLPTITGTSNVCVGSTTQLAGSGTADTTTPWASATPSVATVSNTGLVTGVAAGTSVITYKNNNGCTQTVTVTVNPLPTITGALNVCIGLTTQLTGSATANATTPWTSATPSVATVSNTGLVTAVAVGTSVITYRNSNGCTQTTTVTVNSLPTITGTSNVCIGSTTQLTGSGTADTTTPWASATPTVATVSNTGLVTGVAAGTSIITYKNNNGCTQTVTVTVNPLPTITGTPNVCVGLTTQLAGSGTADTTTPWASATPSVATVSNTGLVTAVAAGTSVITYKNNNGCTQTVTITVNPLPTITGVLNVCIGLTTQLTGSATANATTPWTSATPSVATVSNTGLVTAVAIGTSVITYRNSNGCTQTATVTVNSLPTITGTLNVCAGSTTQLTGSATANATTPWTSATPSVATVSNSGLVTGVAAGTSIITYTNSNGCTQTATITVNALPVIGTHPQPLVLCEGNNGSFTVGTSTPGATYQWQYSNSSTGPWTNTDLETGVNGHTLATLTLTGTPYAYNDYYVQCVVTSNGCSVASAPAKLTVNQLPAAPIQGTKTPYTCTQAGSVDLSGLPLGSWTLTQTGIASNVINGSGTTYTVTGLIAGNYTFTVSNGTCPSLPSATVTIIDLSTTTWNGSTWSNSTPDATKAAVFAGPYTIAADLEACSCTINSGVNLVVPTGRTLKVTNALHVATGASLTFEDSSSLVQVNDASVNTGNITYKRITKQIRQADFTYWSTPVSPQKLIDVSEGTQYNMYMGFTGTNWLVTDRSTDMMVGKGYIIRGPQNYSNTAKADYEASFKGVPNNGIISGESLLGGKYYLIGNPYPSAIRASKFLAANLFMNGTLYFWTHNTPVVLGGAYQYTTSDYASYNLTGGTATAPAKSGNSGNNNNTPLGYIAAGQSFFASAASDGIIHFNNDMREGGTNNGQFFKPGKTAKETDTDGHHIWLNLTNEGGAFKQMLVGYVDGATNDFDKNYDGKTFDGNMYVDFYSVNDQKKYVIQGRALPFADTDIVPLGYRTTIAGDFTISIDQADGDLATHAVYIEDKTTGIVHDLKAGKFTFTTAAGTFTDRLVLRYTNKTLGTGDFENTENGILVSVKNKVIRVNSAKETIKDVTIFDISGKLLYNKNKIGTTDFQISNLQAGNQVLLVKVTLDNNYSVTKKIIFQ